MITLVLLAIVIGVIAIVRSSAAINKADENMKALKAVCKFSGFRLYHYDWMDTWTLESINPDQNAVPMREHSRLQTQFQTLLESLGMKFVPEKTEEVHQGDKHEVKVTPAKFVKSKSR